MHNFWVSFCCTITTQVEKDHIQKQEPFFVRRGKHENIDSYLLVRTLRNARGLERSWEYWNREEWRAEMRVRVFYCLQFYYHYHVPM